MKNLTKELQTTIAQALNLSSLTSAQQEKVISMLMSAVAIKVEMLLWERLSEDEREELKKTKLEGKELEDYMVDKIPNVAGLIEEITRKTVTDFKRKRAELVA